MRGHRFVVVSGTAAGVVAGLLVVLSEDRIDPHAKQVVSNAGFVTGGLAAVVCCGLAARAARGRGRRAWLLLIATASCWWAGNLWWCYYQLLAGSAPYPSPADVFWLAALPPAAGALLSITPGGDRGGPARAVLDAVIVAGSVLFISEALVLPGIFTAASGPALARVVFVAYPIGDLGLLTLAILALARCRRRPPLHLLLVSAGFGSYAVADTAFAALAAKGAFVTGTADDVGWIAGYLLVALAALSPGATAPAPAPAGEEAVGRSSVLGSLIVYAPMLAAVVVAERVGVKADVVLVGVGAGVLVLFGARQALLAADNVALRRELEDRVAARTAQLRRLAGQSQQILDSVAEGIYGVDAEGRLTFVNRAAARMLGYPAEELLGRSDRTFRPAQPAGAVSPVGLTLSSGEPQQSADEVYLRRDGSEIPVDVTTGPIADGRGVVGAVVAFRDVTQRREVDRIKNEFVSVVSHELRTPLTSVRGSLGLLGAGAVGELPPGAARMIAIAVDNSERLIRLINDILDIDRLESGQMPMEFTAHDVADVVAGTVESLRPMAQTARVRLAADRVGGRVHADADRLGQVLTNLISNAIKFSPPGGRVTVTATPAGRQVAFAVADHGRGIPPDQLESIFGRFQQVDSSDSRQKGGTGLGLAISRGIVDRHGGRIWAENRPGGGACLRFTIPAATAPPVADQVRGGGPTVLLCDDDPDLTEVLGELLTQRGYRTVRVTDARDAVHHARRQPPDVIVLDLRMPGMSGWEAIEELKADPRTADIPIVVMSGLSPVDDPDLSAHTDGWLTKPIDEHALSHAVGQAIRRHEARPTVLLVEDDEDLAGVLVTMFARHGIDALHAATCRAAIALSEDLLPDALVLDLHLPDGDGIDVVETLRRHGRLPRLPLIIYSAAEVNGAAREQLQPGSTVFLTKGRVSAEDLETRVLDLIGRLAPTGRSNTGVDAAPAGRR